MLGDVPLTVRAVMMPPGGVGFWVQASPRLARGRASTRSQIHAARWWRQSLGKVRPAGLFIGRSIEGLRSRRKAYHGGGVTLPIAAPPCPRGHQPVTARTSVPRRPRDLNATVATS